MYIFIPVTRKVKWYTRFVGKYVTGRRKESIVPLYPRNFIRKILNLYIDRIKALLKPKHWPETTYGGQG